MQDDNIYMKYIYDFFFTIYAVELIQWRRCVGHDMILSWVDNMQVLPSDKNHTR